MMGGSRPTMGEARDIHALLANHDRIKRTVTNLPDGIRTVTESDDPEVAAMIKSHVAQMGERVEAEGRIRVCRSKARRCTSIFRNKDKIKTTYETTANGIVVIQTSTDPNTVAVLQDHAAEVTDLVKGGMVPAHGHDEERRRHDGSRIMHGPMADPQHQH